MASAPPSAANHCRSIASARGTSSTTIIRNGNDGPAAAVVFGVSGLVGGGWVAGQPVSSTDTKGKNA